MALADGLMMAGAGLCTLAVLTLLSLVVAVIWDGERYAGEVRDGSGRGAPGGAGRSRDHGYRRSRNRYRPAGTSLIGLLVLTLAMSGVVGSAVFVAGYFLSTAGAHPELRATMDRIKKPPRGRR